MHPYRDAGTQDAKAGVTQTLTGTIVMVGQEYNADHKVQLDCPGIGKVKLEVTPGEARELAPYLYGRRLTVTVEVDGNERRLSWQEG